MDNLWAIDPTGLDLKQMIFDLEDISFDVEWYQYIVHTWCDHRSVKLLDDKENFPIENHVNIWHNVKIHCNTVEVADLMETYLNQSIENK